MKILGLSIQGLNSFGESQYIDFSRLCARGLFGILGKTGSGKSSILDAITLALFGEVPRWGSRQAHSVLNKNYDGDLRVILEFEVRGLRYSVERGLRRGTTSLSAILKMGDKVLAEKTTEVTRAVEGIVGLGYKDFSLSVVLAQGRFNDFLMMENAKRSEALSRIFRLEAYGESLSAKVREELEGTSDAIRGLAVLQQEEAEGKRALVAEGHARMRQLADEAAVLEGLVDATLASLHALERAGRQAEEYGRTKEELLLALKEESICVETALSAKEALRALHPSFEAVSARWDNEYQKIMAQSSAVEQAIAHASKAEEARRYLQNQLEGWQERTARLGAQLLSRKQEVADKAAGLEHYARQQAELEEFLRNKNQQLEEAREEYSQLLMLQRAAALSQSLVHGLPCPLCGSPEHPSPAQAVPDAQAEELKRRGTLLSAEVADIQKRLEDTRRQEAVQKNDTERIHQDMVRIVAEEAQARAASTEAAEALRSQADGTKDIRGLQEAKDSLDKEAGLLLAEYQSCKKEYEAAERAQAAADNALEVRRRLVDSLRAQAERIGAGLAEAMAQAGIRGTDGIPAGAMADTQAALQRHRTALDANRNEGLGLSHAINLAERELDDHTRDLEKRDKLARRHSILEELATLFKGKKFVEFMAVRHLRACLGGATAQLSQMSAGRYSLELDGHELVVVDRGMGGTRRHPRSLSGGETFMVSLCLALALASGIAMRSNTPLEMLFLDEGFGSLDRSSLDTVMTSLEALVREEHIIVGIISHVEELHHRVPARLSVQQSPSFTSTVSLDL